MAGDGERNSWGDSFNTLADVGSFCFLHQIAAGQDDDTRTLQAANRLAKQAAWEDSAQAKRVEGVEQDNVEVAGEAAMLKAVVEDREFAFEFVDGDSCKRSTVAALKMRNVGQVFFEDATFVVKAFGLTVAPAEDRSTKATLARPAGDVFDHRRLAGTAERQVADGNDGDVGFFDLFPAEIKCPIADADTQAVSDRREG